jgi:poly [ADP-ribose] polymerase 2/3/4
MTIEKKTFVCSDASNNNNKFWSYEYDTDTEVCKVKYGRVGKTSNEDDPKVMTRKQLDTKIREKLKGSGKEGTSTYKPPYREITVLAEAQHAPTGPAMAKEVVREAAKKQLASGNSELTKLVDRLVEANRHELVKASGGQMDIDLKTGIISTPIGVVTKDTIKQARVSLDAMSQFVQKKDYDDKTFIQELNNYLMLVPQQVGHARGWHKSFFSTHNTLQSQSTLLDQLEASADLAEARVKSAQDTAVTTTLADTPNLFNAELKILADKDVIKKIETMFFESINQRHESKNMKPVRFYEITMPKAKEAFELYNRLLPANKLKNIQLLWHGTRMFNVLSILKSGLFCPPKSGSFHVTGRMFGDGIYGSDQSTKALNYARGYWDGGPRDKNCFMFLVDFSMGEAYTPKSSYETLPKPGYDSTFAKANLSGVLNNEMIVYKNEQVNIRYLIEFEEK